MNKWLSPLLGATLGTTVTWVHLPKFEILGALSLPATHWFDVQDIHVGDVDAGVSPKVSVLRDIVRPFTATWIATIRNVENEEYSVFCARHGQNDYHPEARLPPDTDLNWWMDIGVNQPCPQLEPGHYTLTIVWIIEAEGSASKIVRKQSNVFEVRP